MSLPSRNSKEAHMGGGISTVGMVVKRVEQGHANGCGPAVIAMLTDRAYDDVLASIEAQDGHGHAGDWNAHGITYLTLDRLLGEAGFYAQHRWRAWYEERIVHADEEPTRIEWKLRDGATWPPEPFAPVHYASVEQPSGHSHFVVVLADGAVLDPLRPGIWRLTDWPGVNQVVGLVTP